MYFNRVTGTRKFLIVLLRGNVVFNVVYSGEPMPPMTEEQFARMQGWLPKANPEAAPGEQSQESENPSASAGETDEEKVQSDQEQRKKIVKDLVLAVLYYVTRKGENDSILLALFKRGLHGYVDRDIEEEINERLSDKGRIEKILVKAAILNILDGHPSIRDIALTTGSNELLALRSEDSPINAAKRDASDLLDAFDELLENPSFKEVLHRLFGPFAD